MPATYEPIATTTLSGATSTITFSSIPATYTDLRVVLVGTVTSVIDVQARLNSDSGSNYGTVRYIGNGSSATSDRISPATVLRVSTGNPSTTIPFAITMDIMSYQSSVFKPIVITWSGNEGSSGSTMRAIGGWFGTSTVNSVSMIGSGDTFKVGTVATLYGILAA